MTTISEDYVVRQIEMIGEMITKALSLKVESRFNEALGILDQAMKEMFGQQADLLEMVDAHTAASLIGDPTKIRTYADLIKTKVDLLSDVKSLSRLRKRYEQLYEEALRLSN